MSTDFLSLISFILISTFTPGPANISSASMGVLHGYKKTFNYLLGLAAGVFFIMLVSGWITTALLRIFPVLEVVLHYVGAAYILYLAYGILKASYDFSDQKDVKPLGMGRGFILQVLNPKLYVYAFTLFSAFLASNTTHAVWIGLTAIVLAMISYVATSVWALFGTGIKAYLQYPRVKTVVNILLALFLVYAAIELAGVS